MTDERLDRNTHIRPVEEEPYIETTKLGAEDTTAKKRSQHQKVFHDQQAGVSGSP